MPPETKRPVEEDHTVDRKDPRPLPPGPPDADDIDFRRDRDHSAPGFSGTPGAGPNPTSSV
ncbi:MAG: hypothetical protein QM639_09315 [Rhodocyclaceae bacterium]